MNNSVRHVSIKARLIILSLIGLIGFSAILVGNLAFFKKTNEKLSTLQSTDLRMVQLASELQVGLTDLNRLFEAAVVEIDEDTLADALKLAEAQKRQITALGQLTNGMQDQHRILTNTFDRYVAENRAYAEDVIAGRYAGDAMYSAFSSALQRREDYDQLLRGMTRNINANFTSTLQLLRDSSIDATERQFTFAALLFLMFALAIIWFIRMITQAIDNVIGVAGQIADGNLDVQVDTSGSEEFRRLFGALDVMRGRLKQQYIENDQRQKRQQQLAQLNESLRGEKTEQALGDNILSCLAQQMGALVGAFYLLEQNQLVLKASYAYTVRKAGHHRFALGESLVGQAALEQKLIVVRDLPADYTPVASGLGEAVPAEVLLLPLTLNGRLLGVVELLAFRTFTAEDLEFLHRGSEAMAIALNSALSRAELSRALEQTQQQADALERQQEELRATNEELEEQASILRASEESLQRQQEELRVMNEELEERNRQLDRQKEEIARNNAALERSRQELQEKARQLEMSGRYKSEFLSTMSHELRTPLNSILILSQGLMENKAGNLDAKQAEHARVIHSSGRDLLLLINDILDLSKVEEGKLELLPEKIALAALVEKLRAQFDAQAESKKLAFNIRLAPGCPQDIVVDEQRVTQILRNFLSNAFKFTHKGAVDLEVEPVRGGNGQHPSASGVIAFRVRDTGIGIPADKQQLIFEAFQQVDGTISRKYGGTGLGLTISRKLAELMGGKITVESHGQNEGSTFSLIIPAVTQTTAVVKPEPVRTQLPAPTFAPETAQATRTILIVEDDVEFSRILHGLAEEYGFEATCVHTAAAAYQYLESSLPGSIILDLGLPDAPGQQFLSHLKSHPRTCDIPVHVISGNPNVTARDLLGASEFIAKPFGRDRLDQLFTDIADDLKAISGRDVLVIEDDPVQCDQLQESFTRRGIVCDLAGSADTALERLAGKRYGAIILDLDLPDHNGFELLEKIAHDKDPHTHIIIYTARDLSRKQDADLRRYADRIILKTDQSIARLLNETSLFLHWLQDKDAPHDSAEKPDASVTLEPGHQILLVDDDIRNLYSLSSVLEDAGLDVATASTGVEALEMLDSKPNIDLILMDIMMPEMDGFEAMKRIRASERHKDIPIIALTAKAMRDDRARCIEAGANDYMSKPVDTGKLKAVVKLWLRQ